MRERSSLLIAAVLLVLALPTCSRGTQVRAPAGHLEAGEEAPGFTLPSAQGGTVSLHEFRGGQAVLLYFSMGPG